MLKMKQKNVEEDEIDPVEEKKNSRVREVVNLWSFSVAYSNSSTQVFINLGHSTDKKKIPSSLPPCNLTTAKPF